MSLSAYTRRRGHRAKAGALVLTERDYDLLAFVGLSGYVASTQLGREFFPTIDRCRRRLRQLFDARLIAITLAASTKPNLVSLTKRGLSEVIVHDPTLEGRARLAGAIRLAGVEHHLAIVDVRLYAAAWGRERQTPLLRWSNAGGELGRELGLEQWHLVPDAVADFGEGVGLVAIEVDCGTETRSIVGTKLDRYGGAIESGALSELWLVVSAGADRRRGLHELVEASGLKAVVEVIDHSRLVGRPASFQAPSGKRA